MLLSGCTGRCGIYANYRSLADLETVSTLGLDRTPDGITLSAAADRADPEQPAAVLRRNSPDLRQGLDALQNYAADRQLYFAHTRFFLLGEDYARAGIGQLLDYVERDVNMRMGTDVFLLRGDRADALVTADGDVSALLASVVRNTDANGGSHVSDIRDVAVALSEYGAAAVCALRMVSPEGSVFSEGTGRLAVPDGYAILKDGALAGYVDGNAGAALGFLAGHPGTVTRRFGGENGVTLELRRAGRPAFRFRKTPQGLTAEVTLRLNAVLSALDAAGQSTGLPDLAELSALVAEEIGNDATAVLACSKALNADFLALGRDVRRKFGPAEQEGFLQKTDFQVNVEVILDHGYDMSAPLGMRGGAA